MAKNIKSDLEIVELAVGGGRCSFPTLHKNSEYLGKDKGYREVSIILDKDNPQHIAVMDKIKAVMKDYKVKAGKKIDNMPVIDGDKYNANAEEEGEAIKEEYENAWILNLTGKKGFTILDGQRRQVSDDAVEAMFYAGCYINVFISSSCFENEYGVTAKLTLNGIMFAGDGEAFGAVQIASDSSKFDSFDEVSASDAPKEKAEKTDDDDF